MAVWGWQDAGFSCDECSALWAEIENIEIGNEIRASDLAENSMPVTNVSIYGSSAGWAVMKDMIEQGISDEVAGEGNWVEARKY